MSVFWNSHCTQLLEQSNDIFRFLHLKVLKKGVSSKFVHYIAVFTGAVICIRFLCSQISVLCYDVCQCVWGVGSLSNLSRLHCSTIITEHWASVWPLSHCLPFSYFLSTCLTCLEPDRCTFIREMSPTSADPLVWSWAENCYSFQWHSTVAIVTEERSYKSPPPLTLQRYIRKQSA